MSFFDTGAKIREIDNKMKNNDKNIDLVNVLYEFNKKMDKFNENLENLAEIMKNINFLRIPEENSENFNKISKNSQIHQDSDYIPSIDTKNISMRGKETTGKIISSNLSNNLDVFEELEKK